MTLVRRKRNREEGPSSPRPVLLSLYGCYGLPLDPGFDPLRLALARSKGFDLAFAHLRGGGELGRRWHAEGRGENRRRVVEDAREVVEWLSVGNGSGYESGSRGGGGSGEGAAGEEEEEEEARRPRRPVSLSAESAGGLVAGALLADPGAARLLSAVSLRVPFVDVLGGLAEEDEREDDEEERHLLQRQRSLLEHERGEFASTTPGDDPFSSALASVCPYYLLSEAERKNKTSEPLPGPPVLVTLAENDARVPAASVAKWVARLRRLRGGGGRGGIQEASSPVFLYVLRDCGHAEGLRSEDDIEANAREAAFLVEATKKWKERES